MSSAGLFDKNGFRSGCRFTLYQLRRELEAQGHSLRYDELIEGLNILSLSSIEIEGKEDQASPNFARSPYFPLLVGVTRQDFAADSKARWLVQFHPLVTDSIQQITYRQFNYKRLMNCRTQLSPWLICQLVLKYTQASIINSFEMRYSTIKRDSALLEGYKRGRDAVAALDAAWDEIKALKVLTVVEKKQQRGHRGKLEDVIYTLYPSPGFTAEQKASNRRQSSAKISSGPLSGQTLVPFHGQPKDPCGFAELVDKSDPPRKKRGE